MAHRNRLSAAQVAVRDARQLILDGSAPAGLTVTGKLDLSGQTALTTLPAGLTAGWFDLSGCTGLTALPADLRVRRLTLGGSWDPSPLLRGLTCYQLDLQNTAVRGLPADLRVEHRLDLEGCVGLESLPAGLKVGCLNLRGCTGLRSLPEGLDCYFLDVSGCTALDGWPERASVSVGRLAARGCLQLRQLPPWLTSIAQLDLRDCVAMRELPDGLVVGSWVDVAGTRIRSLPAGLADVQLRWRGVAVDRRVAFCPELITADEILAEPNAERRRVLLERMGYESFLAHARAEVLDEDRDPGGPRRLVRVPMGVDEPLVCVSVLCPSTGRQYVIRVPPATPTCHAAAAWIAGFDDPADYRPLAET